MSAQEGELTDEGRGGNNWISNWWPSLVIVTLGVGIRIVPNISYFIWGNDFGIYFYLSNSYLNLHSWVIPPPSPWGIDGYQYFPATYIIADAVRVITGLPLLISLKFSIPVLGGLTPLLIYYISREMKMGRGISFLAAVLLAIDPVQLFQTSQANYLTTGHFFLLLSVLLFIRYHNNAAYLIPALLSAIALTLSHQLSSFILVISIIGMVVAVQLYDGKWKRFILRDFIYIIFAGSFLLGYLILRVPTSKYFLVNAASGMGLPWIFLSFFAVVLSIFFLLKKGSACCSLGRVMERFRNKRKSEKKRADIMLLILSVAVIEISLAILVITNTYSFIGYFSLALSLPFVVFLSISVIGAKNSLIDGKFPALTGWIVAVTIAMMYSAASANRTLEVARLLEYLTEPFSMIAGITLLNFYFRDDKTSPSRSKQSPIQDFHQKDEITNTGKNSWLSIDQNYIVSIGYHSKLFPLFRSKRAILVVFVLALSLSLIATSYSMPSLFVPSGDEGATVEDAAAIAYLSSMGERNFSVATDHQLGLLLYNYGFKSPFDKISSLWVSNNWREAIWELEGENSSYLKVGYVLIDSSMINEGIWGFNGVTDPTQPPVHMTVLSFNKFFNTPFKLIFKASSPNNRSAAYLFAVNISYVNSYFSILLSTDAQNITGKSNYDAHLYNFTFLNSANENMITNACSNSSHHILDYDNAVISYASHLPLRKEFISFRFEFRYQHTE